MTKTDEQRYNELPQADRVENALEALRLTEKLRQENVNEFAERMKVNSSHAFEYTANGAMQAAAELDFTREMIRMVEYVRDGTCTLRDALDTGDRMWDIAVTNMTSTSTSVIANEWNRCRMVAWRNWKKEFIGRGYRSKIAELFAD